MERRYTYLALASLALIPLCKGVEYYDKHGDDIPDATLEEKPPRKAPVARRHVSSPSDAGEEDPSDTGLDIEVKEFQSCLRRHAMQQVQYHASYYECVYSDWTQCNPYNDLIEAQIDVLQDDPTTIQICEDVAFNPSKFTLDDPGLEDFKRWLTLNHVHSIRTIPDFYGHVDKITGEVEGRGLRLYCKAQNSTYECSLQGSWHGDHTVQPEVSIPFIAYTMDEGIDKYAYEFLNSGCQVNFYPMYSLESPDLTNDCKDLSEQYPDCELPLECDETPDTAYDSEEDDTGNLDSGSY